MALIPNENKAREFIEKQIWGDKAICAFCNSKKIYIRKHRKGYRCGECLKDFTIRTRTRSKGALVIFENSRLPLHKWLFAMYLIVNSRKGISSLHDQREL